MRMVALRKESVDRNPNVIRHAINLHVALRKESVDRNQQRSHQSWLGSQSLSARRAWIEIRNAAISGAWAWSLSARRAWIEMKSPFAGNKMRNGRSPQGERG